MSIKEVRSFGESVTSNQLLQSSETPPCSVWGVTGIDEVTRHEAFTDKGLTDNLILIWHDISLSGSFLALV